MKRVFVNIEIRPRIFLQVAFGLLLVPIPSLGQYTQGIVEYRDCIKTLDVRGFQNVLNPGMYPTHRYLFLLAASVRDCGESSRNIYSPTGDIGLRIYGGAHYETELATVRLYGPYDEGRDNDGSKKLEWLNYCTVYYNGFALMDLTGYDYANVRIICEEGDDSGSKDDVVFDAIVNLEKIVAGMNTVTGHCDIPSQCATLMFTIDSYQSNSNCGYYWDRALNNVRPLPRSARRNDYDPRKWGKQALAFTFWVSDQVYHKVLSAVTWGSYPHQWAVIEYSDGYCIFNRFKGKRTLRDVINHATGYGDCDWWPWPEGSPHVCLSSPGAALSIATVHGGIADIRWIDHPTARGGY